MAFVDPQVAATIAHLDGVHAAVIAQRDELEGVAEGLFASHNNPGGHEFSARDEKTDALLDFTGPAPLSVEYGHWTADHKRHVEGLHILARAIATARA